jgi:hypothetical protein
VTGGILAGIPARWMGEIPTPTAGNCLMQRSLTVRILTLMHEPDRALQHIITIQEVIPMMTSTLTTPSAAPPTTAPIWINPRASLDRVTLLADNTLIVANPSAEVAAQLPARLAAGEPLKALLGGKATVIPLADIRKVRGKQGADDLDVHYTAQGKVRMMNVGFADNATRDEVLDTLQHRMGAGFQVRVQELSPLQAAIKPFFMLLVATFFVVAGFVGALEIAAGAEYDISGRGALLQRAYVSIVSLLGPVGVLVLGGLLVLGLLVWFVRRVLNPPTQMTLTRAK